MGMMNIVATVTIPVSARPSLFVGGQFDGWGERIAAFENVDLTINLEGFPEIEDGMDTDEIADAAKDAEWDTDYTDEMLRAAIEHAAAEFVGDVADMDENGDGCDGVVQIVLGEPVVLKGASYLTTAEYDFAADGIREATGDIVDEWAFGDNGFKGTWFVDDGGAVHPGSPLDKANWQK